MEHTNNYQKMIVENNDKIPNEKLNIPPNVNDDDEWFTPQQISNGP